MYLDLSTKKISIISIGIIVLFMLVSFTVAGKTSYFGTTPYDYSALLGFRYAFDTLTIAIEEGATRAYESFAAIFGYPVSENMIASPETARGIPVLTYHRIVTNTNDHNNVTVEQFKNQMQILKAAGWHTVTLEQFEAFMRGERRLPLRSFLLTFDDGAKESFYPVDPILRALDFHAVLFVIAHSTETAGLSSSIYYLSPQEIQRMLRSGRWDVGSHSYDGHRPYQTDADGKTGIFFADRIWRAEDQRLETPEEFQARVKDDLMHAKQNLEETYNTPIDSFAFPLGNETGVAGANNFPTGSAITAQIASGIYEFGFLQTRGQTFMQNFPRMPEGSTTVTEALHLLSDPFIVHRIHVDYDWDGARLLRILENSLPKSLPYSDDFSTNTGWLSAWGAADIGRNNLQLKGGTTESNSSVFLDGSALWDTYSLDASVEWLHGDFFVLSDVINRTTYDACAFSQGRVRIISSRNGVISVLEDLHDKNIAYGNVHVGMRVHESMIECTWEFSEVVQSANRAWSGGVGFQMYDKTPGTSTRVESMLVRPLGTS